jgi:DNA helicase HerA-like ATPase
MSVKADQAHSGVSKAFLTAITQTVRLIRSKGVGIFFVTQTPKDVPSDVLAQLGNRVQHALRAFTPDDAKALRATVQTSPSPPTTSPPSSPPSAPAKPSSPSSAKLAPPPP